MTKFGTHLKLSIARERKEAVRRFYEEGFGWKRVSPGENLDQFVFGDAVNVGVFYVDAAKALPDDAWEWGPWLEFAVDDVAAAEKRLLANGGVRVAFEDPTHPYLRGPGGPVFRLAKA